MRAADRADARYWLPGCRGCPDARPGARLQGAHRGLLGRFGMVPAAQVQRAVDREQPELVGRRPADVAGLAATALDGLLDRPLDRDDDVAEMQAPAGRQRKGRGRRSAPARPGRDGGGGKTSGGRSGNDRTSVGPRLPRWSAFSSASSASSDRIRPIDAGDGAPAASAARTIARASAAPEIGAWTPARIVRSTRQGPR